MSSGNQLKKNHTPVDAGIRNLSPKTMVMIALMAVMGILWGRVLLSGNDGPEKAEAQVAGQVQLQESMQSEQVSVGEIDVVKLPEIPGRNDTLASNFFSAESDGVFKLNGENGFHVKSAEQSIERSLQLKLEAIAEHLALEAVIKDGRGIPYKAFIDGKILSVGQTLTVQEGPDQYVLTMNEISENEVTFSWNKVSVVLKMPETFEL